MYGAREIFVVLVQIEPYFESSVCRIFDRIYTDPRNTGCPELRIDTNAKNAAARRLYAYLGYREAGTMPCNFNGIDGVSLVCLEKWLGTQV